jgi:hypothetical protein
MWGVTAQSTYDVQDIDTTPAVSPGPGPVPAVLSSAAVPGAGQLRRGAYLKAAGFFIGEVSFGLVAHNRWTAIDYYDTRLTAIERTLDTLQRQRDIYRAMQAVHEQMYVPGLYAGRASHTMPYDSFVHSADAQYRAMLQSRELALYRKKQSRYEFYNWVCVTATWHLYNVCDALAGTSWHDDHGARDPLVAGSLSAVPFLGLGQVYNGSFSKAGLVCAVTTSLSFMALNYHRLMQYAAQKARYYDTHPEIEGAREMEMTWRDMHNDAFNLRNVYLWYDLVFYLYGIFDAVVDAHLHDMPVQMKFSPMQDRAGIAVQAELTY